MSTVNKVPFLKFMEQDGMDNTSEIPSSLRDHLEPVDLDFFDTGKKCLPQSKRAEYSYSSVGNLNEKINEELNKSLSFTNTNPKPVIVR